MYSQNSSGISSSSFSFANLVPLYATKCNTNLKKPKNIETENKLNDFNSAIKWWERKRLIYNIITLLGGLAVIIGRSEVPNGISSYNDFVIIIFWLFGANIFYTCGWGLEALLNYYFKFSFFGRTTRQAFFVIGTLFSFFWMFLLVTQIN